MKKLLFALIAIALLSGCQNVYNYFEDIHLEGMADGHSLYYLPEFDTLDTHAKIGAWINAHVEYDLTYSDVDTWANPEDTIRSGKATCADFAVLYLNIAYFGLKQKGEIVCGVNKASRSIEAGGDVNHAQVRFGNTVIEPQNGSISTMTVGYAYSFDEVYE